MSPVLPPIVSNNVQVCQMVYFHTKNPNLGKFWTALEWKRLANSLAIWNKLPTAI
jgi:hypothetical protein